MSYARRRNRKLKRDLVSKPKLVEKVVKQHNKKAKEQREGDEKFEKIVSGIILSIIAITLIVKYIVE
jgi:hypothetical protein